MVLRSLRCLALAAVVGVSGCAAPRLPTPDIALPTTFELPAGTADARSPPRTLDRWWSLFEDAQLTGLVEDALAASPDAKSALGRLREARANRDQALSDFWPKGNLTGSVTEQYSKQTSSFGGVAGGTGVGGFASPSGETQTYAGQFLPTWELDLFGDFRVARRAADADLSAARFDYEATRISLAAEVATELFQARGLAVQLADARENLRISKALADSGARKVAAGLAATSETARLDSDARTSESEVARLEASLRVQKRRLLALVGRGAAPLDSLAVEPAIAAAPAAPATTPGELLARRPDVRRAERQLASAAARVQLDNLSLFPRLTLQPGVQLSKTEGAYSSFSRLWSIGVGVQVPILDRPRLQAELRAQTARGEQAVAAYEKAVQGAYSDAETALATLQADQVRIAALAQAESRSRFAFGANSIGYRAGLTDLTTLIQAERDWRAARASLRSLQTVALQDAVNAFKALGGGWAPDGPAPVKTAENRVR